MTNKTEWIEWREVEPYSINLDSCHDERFPTKKPFREVDLDGGVPYKKSEKKLKIISKNS
jgi:hypothetical protein